ncbi:unnamed protein product [Rotaria magnacalcarata]|uniref:Peptidase S9 prolyl oligopeptidase catalytic domain-containing protein n=1 Tax=Rotaria magnacalcarata TaxID=392030 RepID=A0A816SPZ5_9BILA|nr:unnamed protein product [Rotaria magnacalcarata]
MKIIFHLIDLSLVNAWLLYRRHCSQNQIHTKDVLSLLTFRIDVAKSLLQSSPPPPPVQRGRPSLQNISDQNNTTIDVRAAPVPVPPTSTRIDKFDHWPVSTTKGRCAVKDFALLENGRKDVILLGQLNTEIQIYTQRSAYDPLIKLTGWNETHENLVTTCVESKSTITFIHSSFGAPPEIYCINTIDQLNSAKKVTKENKLFTERNLPKGISYRWINKDDETEIESVLLYPPNKHQEKNLPLLVLMHGEPYSADLNTFRTDWFYIAGMMATEYWLVFQPNYRGSTSYGDEFLHGILEVLIARPGKDVLFGVDALVQDGIADPERLAIGGYSYGGHLTNWLITQTTRFNAALTGAGAVEHVNSWGLADLALYRTYKLGGFPWQVSNRYQQVSPIFQFDKFRTPTYIAVDENDYRVPTSQAYLLKRSLHVLGIPSKLIVFPGEGHILKTIHGMRKLK